MLLDSRAGRGSVQVFVVLECMIMETFVSNFIVLASVFINDE
jgi:hypothetical protein